MAPLVLAGVACAG